MTDDTLAVAYGEQTWTWREHLAEAAAEASALIGLADTDSSAARRRAARQLARRCCARWPPPALGGYVLCGINTTRRGAGLLADIRRADCQLLLADADHLPLLDGLDLHGITVLDVTSHRYARRGRRRAGPLVPYREVAGRRHLHDDLHVGHQRRSQGGAVRACDGNAVRRKPGRTVRHHRRRRVLPVDAAVPLQRRGGRLGGRHRLPAPRWFPPGSRRRGSLPTSVATASRT